MKLEEAIQTKSFTSQKYKAILNVLYTSWWCKTAVSQELKNFGLTNEQYNVLRILKGKHPEALCVRDIGCRMIERSSNVPRIIDRLVVKKLVKRSVSPTDKRETLISLTPAGINILQLSTEKINSLFEREMELSESDAETLNILLEKLREKE